MTYFRSLNFRTLIPVLILSCFSLLIISACGDDEDPIDEACANITTLDGEVDLDGSTLKLTVAQLLISGGAGFGDNYLFQITGISDNCSETKSVSFTVTVPSGASIEGSYNITDFFSAGDGDVYGSYTSQILDPISQTLVDLESGSMTIQESGTKLFTIDLSATLVGGGDVEMNITHQF